MPTKNAADKVNGGFIILLDLDEVAIFNGIASGNPKPKDNEVIMVPV